MAVGEACVNHYFFDIAYLNRFWFLSNKYLYCCSCGCLLPGLVCLRPSFASKRVVDEDILEIAVGGWRRTGGDPFLNERVQHQKCAAVLNVWSPLCNW